MFLILDCSYKCFTSIGWIVCLFLCCWTFSWSALAETCFSVSHDNIRDDVAFPFCQLCAPFNLSVPFFRDVWEVIGGPHDAEIHEPLWQPRWKFSVWSNGNSSLIVSFIPYVLKCVHSQRYESFHFICKKYICFHCIYITKHNI